MEIHVIDNGRIHYGDSLRQQQEFFDHALKRKRMNLSTDSYLIFNEHYPVITLGKHADAHNLLVSREFLKKRNIEIYDISRGGDITFHGLGQWTIYPILDLEALGIGLRQYVENLEEVAIQVAAKYGVKGKRIHGASGVWVGDVKPRKLCAVGIQASRYITMHGIAFNVTTSPDDFSVINPCGFTDKGVTNLCNESNVLISMAQAKEDICDFFSSVFHVSLINN